MARIRPADEKSGMLINKRELRKIHENPPYGCSVATVDDNLFYWRAKIEGPPDTPYAGGIFTLEIHFPDDYPMKAPKAFFTTEIYHPNIRSRSNFCLMLANWSPAFTMFTDVAAVYLQDIAKFKRTAEQWTKKYAM